jgi:hypothetical protein
MTGKRPREVSRALWTGGVLFAAIFFIFRGAAIPEEGPGGAKSGTTSVKEPGALPKSYRVFERKKLSASERRTLEKERADRIKSAEKFLRDRQKEYDGIPWENRHILKTQHFEIHCNSTLNVAKAYGALMELIRSKLLGIFKSKIQRNLRAPVFIYASQDEFMGRDQLGRFGGRGLGGYYNPTTQAITTYHGTFGFTGTTFGVLSHEGTHYFQGLVLKDFDNIPMWLIEGLAVYVGDGSTFDPKTKKMEVGKIPRDRLAHIQEKILHKRHTPIEKLVNMTRGIGGFTGSHYADSWALIYYLVNSGEKGKKLLSDYWAIGLDRLLKKKDFLDLAVKYYGGVKDLEVQYIEYILGLEMPPAGRVVGDYFQSDTFQFDFRAPDDGWVFFEDRDDKMCLFGLVDPGSSAEVRVYYVSNLYAADSKTYFGAYLRMAEASFKDVKHEEVKVSGLGGYKLTYSAPSRKAADFVPGPEIDPARQGTAPAAPRPVTKAKGKEPDDKADWRDVVEFKLIQVDGVVTIVCSAPRGEGPRFAGVFGRMNDNFTLTFTRRW